MRATDGTHPRPTSIESVQRATDRAQDVQARRVVTPPESEQLVKLDLEEQEWWEPGVAWLRDLEPET